MHNYIKAKRKNCIFNKNRNLPISRIWRTIKKLSCTQTKFNSHNSLPTDKIAEEFLIDLNPARFAFDLCPLVTMEQIQNFYLMNLIRFSQLKKIPLSP